MPLKIALLIDADNISHKELPRILEEVQAHGKIIVKAVYGDWEQAHLQNWREVAEQHNFYLRHQTNNPNTKNSTDSRLMLEAMDVLYRTPTNCFCLVTNDADYIPLYNRLHEAKKRVIGIGYYHASEALIRSCDQFIFIGQRQSPIQATIESLVSVPEPVVVVEPVEPTPLNSSQKLEFKKLLSIAMAKVSTDNDGWVDISLLGTALHQQTNFDSSNYGDARLNQLLTQMLDFVDIKEAIPTSARLKPNVVSKRSKLNTIQKLVIDAFKIEGEAVNWVTLQTLSSTLRQLQEGFTTKEYGYATLSKLLKSMPDLIEIQQGSPKLIRLKSYVAPKLPKSQKPKNLQKLSHAKKLIIQAFSIVPHTDNWVTLSALGSALSQVKKGFSSKTYGHGNLTKLLQNLPDLVELQFEGKVAKLARLKK